MTKSLEKKEDKNIIKQEFNLENLISQGISKGLPIETMKELLAMRKELKDEWAKEQYFSALTTFQSLCPVIKKNKDVMNKDGKSKRYSYAPLEDIVSQVKDLLQQCGFSYTLTSRQEKNEYISICTVHHKDGHSEISEFKLPLEDSQYMSSIQKVGSTRTYANRYCFCNAFGIMTEDEDNDGNIEENQINDNPVCPNCLHNFRVIKSKYPGKQWYCLECKKGFDVEYEGKKEKEEILAKARTLTEKIKTDGKVQYFIDLSKSNDIYSQDQYLLDLQYLERLGKEEIEIEDGEIDFNDEHMQETEEQKVDREFHKATNKIVKDLQKDYP